MKTYTDLPQMYKDNLISHSDILVFWGKRGKGKSSLQAMFNVLFMQPRNAREDIKLCKELCDEINESGLNLKPPTDHTVFVDTYAQSIGPKLRSCYAYEFVNLEFGLPNEKHPTGLLCPCGKYSFDEAQKLFDSHMGNLSVFVSAAMELSRQPELSILIAVQRPKRLPVDIRELATFIEPIEMKNYYNKYGRLIRTEWICNIIYDNAKLENYLNSHDEKNIDKRVRFVFEGNIYRCYNSRYFLPSFYAGLKQTLVKTQTIELNKCKDVEFSPQGFEDFHRRHGVDIPDSYRGKTT